MKLDPYKAPGAKLREPAPGSPKQRTYGVFVAFGAVFVLDAVVMNQGLVAMIGSVVLVIVVLATGIRRPLFVLKMFAALALAPGVIGTNQLQNRLAKQRAENIIGAAEAYRRDEGHYPKSLDDLVPGYLASVPRAKYTLNGEFEYRSGAESTCLYYVALPPFGRPYYTFETMRWSYLD